MAKCGLEDIGRAIELVERLDSISDSSKALGGYSSLPLDYSWWLPVLTRMAALFTTSSFADSSFLGWRELPYLMVSLLEEWLPFPEAIAKKCAGLPTLPSPTVVLPISSVSTLAIPPGEVDSMIEPWKLQFSLGESSTRVSYLLQLKLSYIIRLSTLMLRLLQKGQVKRMSTAPYMIHLTMLLLLLLRPPAMYLLPLLKSPSTLLWLILSHVFTLNNIRFLLHYLWGLCVACNHDYFYLLITPHEMDMIVLYCIPLCFLG